MIRVIQIWMLLTLFIIHSACNKESNELTNPYEDWKSEDVLYKGEDDLEFNTNSIAGLHHFIFKPTCSNSGCHDGNFEPDFRTIESTYNTLININVIKTDPDNPQYKFRVVPLQSDKSMLIHRLQHNILNNSGIMPLSIDPLSDWLERKEEYISGIKQWIDEGAHDVLGNKPGSTDVPPQIQGLIAFANGSAEPITRLSKYGAIPVPPGTNSLKLMIAYSDDNTPVNQFTINKIRFSLSPLDFPPENESNLSIQSAYNEEGLFGPATYFHTVTFNVSNLGVSGDVIWLQTYVSDNVNEETKIPSPYSIFNYKTYFALVIQ